MPEWPDTAPPRHSRDSANLAFHRGDTTRRGRLTFRRDYQSEAAAIARTGRLLEGADEPGDAATPGWHVEPAAAVTIRPSEPVVFSADPVPFTPRRCVCGPDHTGEDIAERPDCPVHGACADARRKLAAADDPDAATLDLPY